MMNNDDPKNGGYTQKRKRRVAFLIPAKNFLSRVVSSWTMGNLKTMTELN